jgi:thiol-disulfide isomerase/thioredoxin
MVSGKRCLLLSLVAVLLGLVSCKSDDRDLAPSFTAKDLRGNNIFVHSGMPRPVMVTFWATWCDPCMEELPLFQEVWLDNSHDFDIVAVCIEAGSRGEVDIAVANMDLVIPVIIDDGTISKKYSVSAVPYTAWVDRDLSFSMKHVGAVSDYRQMIMQLVTMGEAR